MIETLLTALLGPRCPHHCGERIYPKDLAAHLHLEHAGDPDIPDDAVLALLTDRHLAAAYLRRQATAQKAPRP